MVLVALGLARRSGRPRAPGAGLSLRRAGGSPNSLPEGVAWPLPSIILLLAFVAAICAMTHFLSPFAGDNDRPLCQFSRSAPSAAGRLPALETLHGAGDGGGRRADIGRRPRPHRRHACQTPNFSLSAILCAGLITFALALAWDMRDPQTQDAALGCRLLAASGRSARDRAFRLRTARPHLVHGVRPFRGKLRFKAGLGGAFLAFAIYAALGVIALIVDRRALMVSALAYLLVAMNSLFPRDRRADDQRRVVGAHRWRRPAAAVRLLGGARGRAALRVAPGLCAPACPRRVDAQSSLLRPSDARRSRMMKRRR